MKQIRYKDLSVLHQYQQDFPLTQELPPVNGKTVVIYWTGGMDSTFLLYYYLMHGYHVITQWVDLGNNPKKTQAEKEARKAIIGQMKLVFEPTKLFARLKQMDKPVMKIEFVGKSRAELPQALAWVLATSTYTVDHEVVMGYCNGDDAIGYLPQIKNFINSMNTNMLHTPVKVSFPLAGMKKAWYAKAMPACILHATHHCEGIDELDYETPEKCDCAPCKRYRFEMGE